MNKALLTMRCGQKPRRVDVIARLQVPVKIGETRCTTWPEPPDPGSECDYDPPEGSLSPTSRQPPENIKATKEILQIQNLLWDFQGFHGF